MSTPPDHLIRVFLNDDLGNDFLMKVSDNMTMGEILSSISKKKRFSAEQYTVLLKPENNPKEIEANLLNKISVYGVKSIRIAPKENDHVNSKYLYLIKISEIDRPQRLKVIYRVLLMMTN
jgi:hypothetical protein